MCTPQKQGRLIILVAPSGSGKTTIAKKLLADFSDIRFSTSATTRSPRKNENNGEHYFFLSTEEFEQTIKDNGFLEWEYYSGQRYGTLRSEVDKLIENGYFPLLDIEVKGALNVKSIYGKQCVSIFIQPPSIQALEQRLLLRGSESKESLKKRLQEAREELAYADRFDHMVINDDLEAAYKQVKNIVQSFITP